MNSTDYHLLKSHISKSALDVFHESPYKYWWKYLSGKYVEEPTKTFDFGKASHGFVLEPNKWNEEFVVSPTFKGDGSMKRRENFKETHSDKTIISMSEYETLSRRYLEMAGFTQQQIDEIMAAQGYAMGGLIPPESGPMSEGVASLFKNK
jgi:hypothetical protein